MIHLNRQALLSFLDISSDYMEGVDGVLYDYRSGKEKMAYVDMGDIMEMFPAMQHEWYIGIVYSDLEFQIWDEYWALMEPMDGGDGGRDIELEKLASKYNMTVEELNELVYEKDTNMF